MTYVPVLTHATERDIDLLLVEELACSTDFVAWLLTRATGRRHNITSSEVLHSTRRMYNRREIDITLRVVTDAGHYMVLIENKLDADEQINQSQSYREEADTRTEAGLIVLTGLVCPDSYAKNNLGFTRGFDFYVSYETIEDYFRGTARRTSDAVARRLAYRAELMHQAITKARRGYTQVIHPGKRAFTEQYVSLLRELAPMLIPGPSMLRDSAAESVTMIFAPETLPGWSFLPQMRLVHQLREGNANLNFYKWGEHFPALAAHLNEALGGTEFRAEPTENRRKAGTASLKIMVNTPSVDHLSNFDAQLPAIKTGILKTRTLVEWFLSHKSEAHRWSSIVGARSVGVAK